MTWDGTPTVYRSQVTMRPEGTGWRMWTVPVALHGCVAAPVGDIRGAWMVVYTTFMPPRVMTYPSQDEAKREASRAISLRTGWDLRSRFTGDQRKLMGQQYCPHPTGNGYCARTAQPGSAYCAEHQEGGQRA